MNTPLQGNPRIMVISFRTCIFHNWKCFSKLAQGLAIFSLSMVVVSTITFILSTVEELQQDEEGNIKYPNIAFTIELIDSFIVIFFTIEYLLRLVICPNKLRFLKDPLNIVDFAAIIPFYVSILLEGLEDYEIIGKTGKIIRLVRVMRVLRFVQKNKKVRVMRV